MLSRRAVVNCREGAQGRPLSDVGLRESAAHIITLNSNVLAAAYSHTR